MLNRGDLKGVRVGRLWRIPQTEIDKLSSINQNEFAHSPGPNGLPGGYPIRISAKGVEVVLPEEITLEEAIRINVDGLKCEGIDEIKNDGTVVLTDEAYNIQQELYGIDCQEIRFSDMVDIAKEIASAGKKLVAKYG